MASLTKGKTFANGELVTPQKLHELVDLGTVSGIVNADISTTAAIADTKLATISTAGKVSNSATTATAANAASAIVARDGGGSFSAGTITASLAGNAATATTLQTARTINGVSFNGSANITVTADPNAHPHTIANVTGLQTALDGKQASGSYAPATGIAPSAITGTAVITTDSRLSDARTPLTHTHTIANVTGLQTALDGKQASGSYAPATGIAPSAITGTAVITTDSRLSDARTPLTHTHTIANVTGLQTALDGKQASGSYAPATGIAQSAVTNLTTDLAGKAASSHTHGNITNAGAIGATANLPVVTTTSGVLTTVPAGTSGQVLTSNGASTAPSFQTLAATSTNANNLTGGTAGTVPYQSAAGTTAMLAAGTSGQVLRSNGTAAPSWLTLGNSAALNTGTTSGTVATGNHTHAATDISGRFTAFQFGLSSEIAYGGFEQTSEIGTTVLSDAGRNSLPGAILARWQRTNNSGVTSIIGTITSAGSGASTTGVAYNTSSDYRLKTNLEPLTAAVARLLQIPVHRFNWLADLDAPKVDGFLAHEAQVIVPESVTGHKDEVDAEGKPVHQGIDQSKLVPLLVAAVQELAARVAALEAR